LLKPIASPTSRKKITARMADSKKGSTKPSFVGALASGLNRRAFLRQSSAAALVATIAACKPSISNNSAQASSTTEKTEQSTRDKYPFNQHQKKSIFAVQMQLFPDDGDGPSAKDINSLSYLEWSLTDLDNQDDGDGEFILKGVGWLDGLSEQTQGDKFIALTTQQQDKVLQQIGKSSTGENWLSLLIYYLMEALLFDPFYGGNPDQIGWTWLKHQPGFPSPDNATNYRKFR
jgi:gluconate 2-dehydrogenase gamma chain